MEEALEFLQLLGLVKEDEEKFFDRSDVALQVIVMRLFGSKVQGYAEWKCEDILIRAQQVSPNVISRLSKLRL